MEPIEYTVTSGDTLSKDIYNIFMYMLTFMDFIFCIFIMRECIIKDYQYMFVYIYTVDAFMLYVLLKMREESFKSLIVVLCKKYINTKWIEY